MTRLLKPTTTTTEDQTPKSTSSNRCFVAVISLLTILAHACMDARFSWDQLTKAMEVSTTKDKSQNVTCGHVSHGGDNHAAGQQQQQLQQESPRNMTGSWIGDTWIPPTGWKLYSVQELQETFGNQSMLWIGDSTIRRPALGLYEVLKHDIATAKEHSEHLSVPLKEFENNNMLNLNKGRHIDEPCTLHGWNTSTPNLPKICRPMPGHPNKDFLFLMRPCVRYLEQFLLDELSGASNITVNLDILIVGLGVWHVSKNECMGPEKRPINVLMNDTMEVLYSLQQQRPQMKIVWRTSGFDLDHDPSKVYELNDLAMDHIDKHHQQSNSSHNNDNLMTYVNWGGAVEPRSFPDTRIRGDTSAHYGVQPRMVVHQMIANTLHQHESKSKGSAQVEEPGCHDIAAVRDFAGREEDHA